MTKALAAALLGALLLVAAAATQTVREGETFRIVAPGGFFGGIDSGQWGNSIDLLRPTCGSLLAYPNERLPAGLRLVPELASAQPRVSRDRKTYTFTIRSDARFSTGASVTARDFKRALERILTATLESGVSSFFEDIVGA